MTGNLIEETFQDVGLDEQDSLARLTECQPHEDEIEENGAWVLRRFIPIVREATFAGAIGLVRDITELRRRDRMLLIKDATIREIHHRVKNNLQTVASLLRLQARRLDTSEARIELEESVRRISSIALVHETLSRESTERVDFDEVTQRILAMTEDSLVGPDRPVTFIFRGGAGDLSSDVATPLSLILSELIQNAVEHAFIEAGGTVLVQLERRAEHLALIIEDDGGGLPGGFTITGGSNLGLQIVRTLVTELGGELDIGPGGRAGTRVNLTIPLAGVHRGAGRTSD